MKLVPLLILATAASLGPAASAAAQALDYQAYKTRVEPIFLKVRAENEASGHACVKCHTTMASRMRLQPLSPGASAWSEEQSRQNFAVVSRLVTPGDPLKSALLRHPLAAAAGGDPTHTGGKFWATQDNPEWQSIAVWVRAASPGPVTLPAVAPLDFETYKTHVQPILLKKREGHARCIVCHASAEGTGGFRLAPLPPGSTSWTEEETRRNFAAIQRVVVPGDPLASRLLMKPLAFAAGGERVHSGGKHWESQSDPEWQILAAWVGGAVK